MKKKPDYITIFATTLVVAPITLYFIVFIMDLFFNSPFIIFPLSLALTIAITIRYMKWAVANANLLRAERRTIDTEKLSPESPFLDFSKISPLIEDEGVGACLIFLISGLFWLTTYFFVVSMNPDEPLKFDYANCMAFLGFLWACLIYGWVGLWRTFLKELPARKRLFEIFDKKLTGRDQAVCEHCGARSVLINDYMQRSFWWKRGFPKKLLCPQCNARYDLAVDAPFTMAAVLAALMLASSLLIFSQNGANPFFIGFILFWCLYPAVALHELGHAVVGKLTGFRLLEIKIGSGAPVWKTRLFKLPIFFNKGGLSSYVRPLGGPVSGRRFKLFLMIFAGPATNLLTATALIWMYGPALLLENLQSSDLPLTPVFILANLIALFSIDDFKQMIGLLIQSDKKNPTVEDSRSFEEAFSRFLLWEEREEDALRAGLKDYPGAPYLLWCLAGSLSCRGEWAEARDLFLTLLDAEDLDPITNAWVRQSFAYFVYQNNDAAFFSKAGQYARDAYVTLPWEPLMTATMGRALVVDGEYDMGWPLIKRAYFQTTNNLLKGELAAMMACVLKDQGKLDLAEDWIRTAAKTYPGGLMSVDVLKMELALAQKRGRSSTREPVKTIFPGCAKTKQGKP